MEIPCELTFIGKNKRIAKMKRLIDGLNNSVIYVLLLISSNHNMEMLLKAFLAT